MPPSIPKQKQKQKQKKDAPQMGECEWTPCYVHAHARCTAARNELPFRATSAVGCLGPPPFTAHGPSGVWGKSARMLGATPWPREGWEGNVRNACDGGEPPEIFGEAGSPYRTLHIGDLDPYAKSCARVLKPAFYVSIDDPVQESVHTSKAIFIPRNRHMRKWVAISSGRGNQRAHFMLHPPPGHILFSTSS